MINDRINQILVEFLYLIQHILLHIRPSQAAFNLKYFPAV